MHGGIAPAKPECLFLLPVARIETATSHPPSAGRTEAPGRCTLLGVINYRARRAGDATVRKGNKGSGIATKREGQRFAALPEDVR